MTIFTFSFGRPTFDVGVDVSNLCKISSSIVKRRRAGSGLVFPSLVLTIPVRTFHISYQSMFVDHSMLMHPHEKQ